MTELNLGVAVVGAGRWSLQEECKQESCRWILTLDWVVVNSQRDKLGTYIRDEGARRMFRGVTRDERGVGVECDEKRKVKYEVLVI